MPRISRSGSGTSPCILPSNFVNTSAPSHGEKAKSATHNSFDPPEMSNVNRAFGFSRWIRTRIEWTDGYTGAKAISRENGIASDAEISFTALTAFRAESRVASTSLSWEIVYTISSAMTQVRVMDGMARRTAGYAV